MKCEQLVCDFSFFHFRLINLLVHSMLTNSAAQCRNHHSTHLQTTQASSFDSRPEPERAAQQDDCHAGGNLCSIPCVCNARRLVQVKVTKCECYQIPRTGGKQTDYLTFSMFLAGAAHSATTFFDINLYESNDPVVNIIREITQTTEILNHSINFFLYVLCSERFRKEFIKILCGSSCRDSDDKGYTSGASSHSVNTKMSQF